MTTTPAKKINFADLGQVQDATFAHAVNAGTKWTKEDYAYLEEHMFEKSIKELAIALGRTAYSIETVFGKNPHFIELRKNAGSAPEQRAANTKNSKPVENQYFISSNADDLWGTGD